MLYDKNFKYLVLQAVSHTFISPRRKATLFYHKSKYLSLTRLNFFWALLIERERVCEEMAIEKCKDVQNGEIRENSLEDLEQPFLGTQVIDKAVVGSDCSSTNSGDDQNGSIWMVLLSTFVAVCGSFQFGSCVSTYIHICVCSWESKKCYLTDY